MAALGLIAKMSLGLTWNEREVRDEISSLFKDCFVLPNQSDTLSFSFLTSLSGLRVLTKPKVSKSFKWDASEVLSLSRSVIYITVDEAYQLREYKIVGEEVRLFLKVAFDKLFLCIVSENVFVLIWTSKKSFTTRVSHTETQ